MHESRRDCPFQGLEIASGVLARLLTGAVSPETTAHNVREIVNAEEVWRGVISGRCSLVQSGGCQGRRFLVVRTTASCDGKALTARERQVARYAARGSSNKQIAYALGMSPSTVSAHLTAIRGKLGARSRLQIVELWGKLESGD